MMPQVAFEDLSEDQQSTANYIYIGIISFVVVFIAAGAIFTIRAQKRHLKIEQDAAASVLQRWWKRELARRDALDPLRVKKGYKYLTKLDRAWTGLAAAGSAATTLAVKSAIPIWGHTYVGPQLYGATTIWGHILGHSHMGS